MRAGCGLLPAVLLFPLLLAGGPARSQQETFEGLVEVSEVLLDVLVTDADGRVAEGLGPDDFVVEEDGRIVEVTDVDFYTTRYGTEGEATPPQSRWIVLFFHDQSQGGGGRAWHRMDNAAEEVQGWIDSSLFGSDWIAVVRYDYRLELYQDFTQDRLDLLRAVEAAVQGDDPLPQRETRAGGSVPRLAARLGAKGAERAAGDVHRALRLVAEATTPVVGRKMLLLFTSGFGREVGSMGIFTRPDPNLYPPMRTALNDHNVAVYPLDWSPPGNMNPQRFFLETLAKDTGGRFLPSWRGFEEPLETIRDGHHSWYLVSYRTEHPAGEIGYREVDVRVRNPELTVLSRKGYRYGL